MRFKYGHGAVAGLVLMVLGSCAATAYAHGRQPERKGGWWVLMAVAQPSQKQQIAGILSDEKGTLRNLRRQVQDARAALVAKLLSSDQQVDISKEENQLKQAQSALMEERINIALKVRAVLSPQQLAQASELWAKLANLRQQERALIEQARGGSAASTAK